MIPVVPCPPREKVRAARRAQTGASGGPAAQLVAAVAVVALVVAACGDGGGTAPAEAAGAAGGDAGEAGAGVVADSAPYADHEPGLYADLANWICHPDLPTDECRDLRITVLEPDGSTRVEEPAPAADPGFDCFYVYPTTSTDPEPASDLDFDESEIATVRAQVARFATVCRVFAPVYRQVTLAGLRTAGPEDGAQAYRDVVDAWRTYVTEFNDGRGVVVIGHSQGANHLRRMLAQDLDYDREVRRLLVSAVLLGVAVRVPESGGAGGDLRNIPPCRSADDTGCVISWAAYRGEEPPVSDALFGRVQGRGYEALCSDPAELLGTGEPLGTVVLSRVAFIGGVAGFDDLDTEFVSLPGSVRTRCERSGAHSYLAVDLADPDDPRPVDVLMEEGLGPTWGLHLLDGSFAQDELIEIVTRQAAAH